MRQWLIVWSSCLLLSLEGCSTWFNKTSDNITLDTQSSSQAISYSYRISTSSDTATECKSEHCSKVSVKLVAFDGKPKINAFLDQSLAALGEADNESKPPHRSIAAFKDYFFRTTKTAQTVSLESSVIRNSKAVVVIELDSLIFNGQNTLSTTQYLNWLPLADQLITLDGMLLPNRSVALEQLILQRYEQWLRDHKDEIGNLQAFRKIWPFIPTDNIALLDDGLLVSYDPVILAPYQFGKLSWVIPYTQLSNILRPELLPAVVNKN